MKAFLAIGVMTTALLLGCESAPKVADQPGETPRPRIDPPSYESVARKLNSNIIGLDRLWARTTVVVDTTDAEGDPIREQGEGHLQWIRPDRLALTMGKLGEEGFYLGSNPESYWWLDLVNDERVAVVGRHDLADERAADGFGLPVHPLDLAELVGLMPLPETPWDPDEIAPRAHTAWVEDGRLVSLDKPMRAGRANLLVDYSEGAIEHVRLYDSRNRLVATSKLSRYQQVELVTGGGDWPWAPTRVDIVLLDPDDPSARVEAVLSLYAMENRGDRQKEIPFDLERLIKAYRVDRVVDLDERALGG